MSKKLGLTEVVNDKIVIVAEMRYLGPNCVHSCYQPLPFPFFDNVLNLIYSHVNGNLRLK